MITKGIGFYLSHIDWPQLNINEYRLLGRFSYIPLPENIEKRNALTINAQNNDEKCFKYRSLSKFYNPINSFKIGLNYMKEENRDNF